MGTAAIRRKKPHRGRNIFLLILACVCALALGGGMMFCAIYTGVLSDAERFFRDTVREWYYGSPSEGLLPDDGRTFCRRMTARETSRRTMARQTYRTGAAASRLSRSTARRFCKS